MKKTPQQRGRDFEKEIARRVEGTVTPASGALWGSKLDIKTDDYLISCKYTEKKSFSLKYSDLEELDYFATNDSRYPALIFQLDGNNNDNEIWIVQPLNTWIPDA